MVSKVPGIGIGIPSSWMARVVANTGQLGDSNEVRAKLRKLLGDPKPQEVDLDDVPPEIAADGKNGNGRTGENGGTGKKRLAGLVFSEHGRAERIELNGAAVHLTRG